MLDFRYHLASLVAVFLALGLGLLVGVSLRGEGGLAQEEARLAQEIAAGLARLREENRALGDELGRLREELEVQAGLARAALPGLVQGLLEGRYVELVTLPGISREVLVALEGALLAAGARLAPPGEGDSAILLAGPGASPEALAAWRGEPPKGGRSLVWAWSGQAPPGLRRSDVLWVERVESPAGLWALVEGLASGRRGRFGPAEALKALEGRRVR